MIVFIRAMCILLDALTKYFMSYISVRPSHRAPELHINILYLQNSSIPESIVAEQSNHFPWRKIFFDRSLNCDTIDLRQEIVGLMFHARYVRARLDVVAKIEHLGATAVPSGEAVPYHAYIRFSI